MFGKDFGDPIGEFCCGNAPLFPRTQIDIGYAAVEIVALAKAAGRADEHGRNGAFVAQREQLLLQRPHIADHLVKAGAFSR